MTRSRSIDRLRCPGLRLVRSIFVGRSMNDPGLEQAIHAAGDIKQPARRIGISQPSVSNWPRAAAAPQLDDTDAARSQEYALLATLLAGAPDAALLRRIARLRG